MPHHRLGALAYAIWPNRVKEKCRTDLSLAIAHGLDDLCETAPKKDKEKKETNKRNAFEPSRKGIIQLKASVIKKEDGMRMLYNR